MYGKEIGMAEEKSKNLRPPIVAILGHVDHGKTTLLDAIRKTNVAEREAGGITQHIGAYQVTTPQGNAITFIDTPGHEAFSAMRSRGADVSDTVLLIVAANEGVKPQTRESLSHIKAANVPFIVVITKIDLAGANVELVKQELEKEGVLLEGRGGDTVVVPVSAKTGDGIPQLLEMISLVAEMNEVQGDPTAPLEAVVIESAFDKKRGALATVVVREGTLTIGEELSAEGTSAKIKALFDEYGKPRKVVMPGQPAQILGFSSPPPVGALVTRVQEKKDTEEHISSPQVIPEEGKTVQLVIKADTVGRLEALLVSLPSEVGILYKGVGDVVASDVLLAGSFNAPIIAFGVGTSGDVVRLAEAEKVSIFTSSIIYECIQTVKELLKGTHDAQEEKIAGKGEIIALFPYGEARKIAGVRALEGSIVRGALVKLIREEKEVGRARIESIKQREKTLDKIDRGQECGILFGGLSAQAGKVDLKVGDVIESAQTK